MLILGISGGQKDEAAHDLHRGHSHDAAAVLLRDGELVAAIEEERLNRIKHTNCFPRRAIAWCLETAGVTLADVDRIAIGNALWNLVRRDLLRCLDDPGRMLPDRDGRHIAGLFERWFGVDVQERLCFVDHHHAHAWSAFAFSGFGEALVFSVDAVGDDSSAAVFLARDNQLEPLRTYSLEQSLGSFYRNIITYLGFSDFDEYKVMGLAPYGDACVYGAVFRDGFQLLADGDYALDSPARWLARFHEAGVTRWIRRAGQPLSRQHQHLAAALQQTVEAIVFHVLHHHIKATGATRLCLAGGVAQNSTLNGRLLDAGVCDQLFVQPASHDAGTALGAAAMAAAREGDLPRPARLRHVFLGTDIGDRPRVARTLARWRELIDVEDGDGGEAEAGARLLAAGAVIGWVQGRSEFGPRALGHRSILADPRPAGNKDRINAMIKKRESFRPFAPSVMEERAGEFFELPRTAATLSFMTYVVPVKPEKRALLGAVTHVDGTARIQTVSKAADPTFWHLLEACGDLTGVPIVLNTSFNSRSEPIVESIDDALVCFLTSELDAVVIGPYVVRRRHAAGRLPPAARLLISLPSSVRLELQMRGKHDGRPSQAEHAIVRVKDGLLHRARPISAAMFACLCLADDTRTFDELAAIGANAESPMIDELTTELFELWADRLVTLRPPLH